LLFVVSHLFLLFEPFAARKFGFSGGLERERSCLDFAGAYVVGNDDSTPKSSMVTMSTVSEWVLWSVEVFLIFDLGKTEV
jgi:hypothetical protein